MRMLKRVVSMAVWTLLGLYVALIVLTHIPAVQSQLGTQAARAISAKLGTRVDIGRVDIGMLNRLIVDDVQVYDQQGKVMLRAARIAVKLDVASLTEGRVSVASAQVFSAHLDLYQTAPDSKPNYQFALDSLASKDTTASSPLDLRVNAFIMRHSSVAYNRNFEPQTQGHLNPNHLLFSDISAHVVLKAFNPDSLNVNVKRLSLKEQSGLSINKLSLKAAANTTRCALTDFTLAMPATQIGMDSVAASYTMDGGRIVPQSLRFSGAVAKSQLALADVACLLPLDETPNHTFTIEATFYGASSYLRLPSLSLHSTDGDIDLDARGWVRRSDTLTLWHTFVDRLYLSSNAVEEALNIASVENATVRKLIDNAGDVALRGAIGATDEKRLSARLNVTTNTGKADMTLDIARSHSLSGKLLLNDFDLGKLLGNASLGTLSADLALGGTLVPGKTPALSAKGTLGHIDYKAYRYEGIAVDASFRNGGVKGSVSMADPNVDIAISGAYSRHSGQTSVELAASIRHFRPSALNISDRWGDADFTVSLASDITASSLNDAQGIVELANFSMISETDTLRIGRVALNTGLDGQQHYLALESDFGKAELNGMFEYTTLHQSFTNFIATKLPTIPGLPKTSTKVNNDFNATAHITSTAWMEKLLGVPLHLDSPLDITLDVDDKAKEVAMDCRIGSFAYADGAYSDGHVSVNTLNDTLVCNIGVARMTADGSPLEIALAAKAADNRLTTNLTWMSSEGGAFSGQLNSVSQFFLDDDGRQVASVAIQPSHIKMKGVLWDVMPSDITYTKNNVEVRQFAITNGGQHIKVDGKATASRQDSLLVDLSGVDIDYVLSLVDFHAVEFGGLMSGRASLTAPFGDFGANGALVIDSFMFQRGSLGTLHADVAWNPAEKQVDIDAMADDGPDAILRIGGNVSPSWGGLDLTFDAEGTNLDFLESFTGSFMKNIDAKANGTVRLAGPFKALNLTGEMVVNGEATIDPINCKYEMRSDTVRFMPNEIKFCHAPIYDMYGHMGYVDGSLYHQNLKNLTYDLRLEAQELLAYDFHDFGEDSYYGTVYATGDVAIRGKSGEVNIDIDITPVGESTFVYNVSDPDAVADQQFIHWQDATPSDSIDTGYAVHKPEPEEMPTDIILNFLVDCTPQATIRLLMDSRTNDYITLNGEGTIRATYHNNGAFTMFGTYTVRQGTYNITIQDLLKKNFTFSDGSSITFGGNPYEATLNLQAVYTVNGVSLSDLNVGNSFNNNTIRVNCLMNIGGQAMRPQVTFDLDMPTLSTDEKQMIRSVINSEDEMNQQVVYLLGIGRFYPQRANNSASQGENQQSQTSLAMQSLLSGTISTQINNLLSSVIKSNNWNFGANISTGDEGWNNAEYEGLLSGRLLNNRLLVNGQFGYRDNANTASTSFIGDFDIRYLLKPNGNLAIKVYNQTNDRYFTKSSLNTQGIGLIMKKDFNGFGDLLNIRKRKTTP